MLECLTEWMSPALYVWQGTAQVPARVGVRHNMIVPYGAYACADGAVLFAVQTQAEWRRFCGLVLGAAALADDPRFATNASRLSHRAELEATIEDRFKWYPRAEVIRRLEEADIPTGAVNDVPAVVAHRQLAARDRWTTSAVPGGSISALVPPHNIGGVSPRMGAVPALGEHTAEVLAELGSATGRGAET
jgi:crotonobetainyl-CoA:carnitine CoA-transferase CaiB-like acyl-CoA transferase